MTKYEYALARPGSAPDMSGRETFTIISVQSGERMARKAVENAKHLLVEGAPPFMVRRPVGEWERYEENEND